MESIFQHPPLWLNLVLFVAGAAMIAKGAGWFTDGAVAIAAATGLPEMVVGGTVVSIATTMPEFSVSVTAAILDQPATSFGNAVGSTICNIGVILATAALIRPVVIPYKIAKSQGFAMLAAGVVAYALGWNGILAGWRGLILLAGFVLFVWFQIARSDRNEVIPSPDAIPHDWGRTTYLFLIGGACVVGGSVLIVQNAAALARAMGVPELVIALTLVALGTSLPELITAINSSLRGHGEIAIGNVLGANVLNLTVVLGFSATVRPIRISPQSYFLDFPVMVLLMVACVMMAMKRGRIGLAGGGLFLLAYVVYLILMLSFFV